MLIEAAAPSNGGGDSLELEELALKGFVVIFDFVDFNIPFNCFGAFETWTTGGAEVSVGIAIIFGPLLCTGHFRFRPVTNQN